jgi:zinc/manganese transport system substrate-binding protein
MRTRLRSKLCLAAALLAGVLTHSAQAALNVLACEPEWGALVKELAGEQASVYNATSALQDVHHIQARPSLLAAARRADLLVCTGAELEVGWLPLLTRESGNAKIQPGAPGFFEAARFVTLIDVPARLDRSEGDVHSQGNPHIQTDPRNIARVAAALAERLAQLDPANAAAYRSRERSFAERWQQATARWEQRGAALRGVRVVEQHRAFSYLFRWVGIEAVGYLEPKPGLEPSTSHMAQLIEMQKARPAKLIVRTSYNDPRASQWFAERAKIPAVMLPFSVGGSDAAKDLFSWFDDLLDRLLKAAA